jgi:hypothetical protein
VSRSPTPAHVASLAAGSHRRIDAALGALQDQRDESRRLLAVVEDLQGLHLSRAARDSLLDSRAALLEWLVEARRCASVWRERLILLADVEADLVEVSDEVVPGEVAARALSRLGRSGSACNEAALDLYLRSRDRRIAERCVALRAAVADRRSAPATLEALHALLRPTPHVEVADGGPEGFIPTG